jgi:hypothetical protein
MISLAISRRVFVARTAVHSLQRPFQANNRVITVSKDSIGVVCSQNSSQRMSIPVRNLGGWSSDSSPGARMRSENS